MQQKNSMCIMADHRYSVSMLTAPHASKIDQNVARVIRLFHCIGKMSHPMSYGDHKDRGKSRQKRYDATNQNGL